MSDKNPKHPLKKKQAKAKDKKKHGLRINRKVESSESIC